MAMADSIGEAACSARFFVVECEKPDLELLAYYFAEVDGWRSKDALRCVPSIQPILNPIDHAKL